MPVRDKLFAAFSTLALLLLLPTAASAQNYLVDEGTYRLGGTVSFLSQGGDFSAGDISDRSTSLTLNPSAQYFFAPGIALGADVLVNRQSQNGFSRTDLSIGPSASYFFGDASSQAYPFVTANPVYSNITLSNDEGGEESISGFGSAFSGGVAFQLARNVALTGEAFYLIESFSDNDDNSASGNTFGIRFGISAFIY